MFIKLFTYYKRLEICFLYVSLSDDTYCFVLFPKINENNSFKFQQFASLCQHKRLEIYFLSVSLSDDSSCLTYNILIKENHSQYLRSAHDNPVLKLDLYARFSKFDVLILFSTYSIYFWFINLIRQIY